MTELDRLSQAERMLAEAATVPDVRNVVDFAEAARVFAQRARLGTSAVNHATAVKVRAERKLADMVDAGQAAGVIVDKGGLRLDQETSGVRTFDDLGIERRRLAEARLLRDAFTDEQLLTMAAEANVADLVLARQALLSAAKRMVRKTADLASTRSSGDDGGWSPPTVSKASWAEWLPTQPECDLLLTDPPYSTDVDDIVGFASSWLPEALAKVKPTGRAYVCIGAYPDELRAYLNVAPPNGLMLANVLVWEYRNTLGPSPKFDYKLNWQAILYYRGPSAPPLNCPIMVEQFTVQDINAPDGRLGDRYHAWQKPIALADRLIRHSTQPGDVVLDPFTGTGTFVLAAAKLECVAAGCDPDPDMLAIAEDRGCVIER